MGLNPSSPVPLYQQFKTLVEQKIASGEWPPTSLLPTELVLCSTYGISRTTIRDALDELVREGRIYRQRGRGTFVSLPKIIQPVAQLTGFAEELALRGKMPVTSILARRHIAASHRVAEALCIAPGSQVFHIRRLVSVDALPLFVDDSHFLPELDSVLGIDEIERTPIYQLLEAAGKVPAEGEQRLTAVLIGPEQARHLGVASGSAGIAVSRITRDRYGVAQEFTEVLYRGDRYEYTMVLRRT